MKHYPSPLTRTLTAFGIGLTLTAGRVHAAPLSFVLSFTPQVRSHVYTGSQDTYYLEGAVRLLKQSLKQLGSDAVIEIVPGKDHRSLLDASMKARISQEMAATLRRAGIGNDSVP